MGDALGLIGNSENNYTTSAAGLNYTELPISFSAGVSLQSIYDRTGNKSGFMRIRFNSGTYTLDNQKSHDGILACSISTTSSIGSNHTLSYFDRSASPQPYLFMYRPYTHITYFPENKYTQPVVFAAMYEFGSRYSFYFKGLFGTNIVLQGHTGNGEWIVFQTSPSLTVSSIDATLQIWH